MEPREAGRWMHSGGRNRISTSASAFGLSQLERLQWMQDMKTLWRSKLSMLTTSNGRNEQRTFRCVSAGISFRWRCNSSILNQVKPPTGEPYAGDPCWKDPILNFFTAPLQGREFIPIVRERGIRNRAMHWSPGRHDTQQCGMVEGISCQLRFKVSLKRTSP